MIPMVSSSGVGDVGGRIAEIRSRLEQLSGTAGARPPVLEIPGVPGAGRVGAAAADEAASGAGVGGAGVGGAGVGGAGVGGAAAPGVTGGSVGPATGAPDGPRLPEPAAGVGGTGGIGAPTGRAGPSPAGGSSGAALAAKLPANGRPWAGAIEAAATSAGIEPALLAAVVRHESNFDPNVRSHAGAIGLAQLMPGTARGLGVDPTDPIENLAGGARYLRTQLDRFGSVELALAAYNAGPNRVAQAGGIPRIAETQTYVRRVTATWEQLR